MSGPSGYPWFGRDRSPSCPGSDSEIALQEPSESVHGEERAAEMRSQIGRGTTTVFGTDDRRATGSKLEERRVTVTTPPGEVPWGVHANVVDCCGNPNNLVEAR